MEGGSAEASGVGAGAPILDTMGFDDSLYKGEVEHKVLAALTRDGSLTYYVEEEFGATMTKEQLERNEEQTLYNGYSLAFHMLRPLMEVIGIGVKLNGGEVLDKPSKQWACLRAREVVLTHMLEHGDSCWSDAFIESVREQNAIAVLLLLQLRGVR